MNTMFSLSTELLLCNISRVLGSYKQDKDLFRKTAMC